MVMIWRDAVMPLDEAKTVPKDMPTAIIAKTVKGKGVSFMEIRWAGMEKPRNDEAVRTGYGRIGESR